jgi:hypothetical protein
VDQVGADERSANLVLYLHGASGGVWGTCWVDVATEAEAFARARAWGDRWDRFTARLWVGDRPVELGGA